jgi:hypothetical protein
MAGKTGRAYRDLFYGLLVILDIAYILANTLRALACKIHAKALMRLSSVDSF